MTYTLTGVNPSSGDGKFEVDPTGEVFVSGEVFAGESYNLYVRATDDGDPSQR